jgi:dTDP-4-amino-4,6-dideoxygalactose transaminase
MASFVTPGSRSATEESASTHQASMPAAPFSFDFLDLKAQFATLRGEMMAAIAAVMESQHFILGREVKLLEEEMAAMLGSRHAVACASGSDALVLAMLALGIGPGDEVITSPFTFFASAGSIARVGARPVFVDIDPQTFNLHPAELEAAITPRSRAVMPVHLFGLPAEIGAIAGVARSHGLAMIEDAAQAIGARYGGRCAGSFGEFGCFSFFPSKNLGAAGDGGMITTDDQELADRVRMLRVHGSRQKYHHQLLGMNSRLDELQAAILRVKLPHLESWTRERRKRAEHYRKLFDQAGLSAKVRLSATGTAEFRHVYNQFVIRSEQRDALREYLREHGIPTEIYYPLPLHLQAAFAYLGYGKGQLPQAEAASREVLALPIYPELTELQQEIVVAAIATFHTTRN